MNVAARVCRSPDSWAWTDHTQISLPHSLTPPKCSTRANLALINNLGIVYHQYCSSSMRRETKAMAAAAKVRRQQCGSGQLGNGGGSLVRVQRWGRWQRSGGSAAAAAQQRQRRSGSDQLGGQGGSLARVLRWRRQQHGGSIASSSAAVAARQWWRQPAWRRQRQLGGSTTLAAVAAR